MKALYRTAAALLLATSSTAASAAIVQLFDFSEMLSPVIVSETGQQINDSPDFTTDGVDCSNAGGGSEPGVCQFEPNPLQFDIPQAFEVGMLFGNDDPCCGEFFTAELSVFSGALLLGQVTVASNGNDFVDQFIGLRSDTAFDHVELQYVDFPQDTFAARLVARVDFGIEPVAAPEPSGLALLGIGLLALGLRRRRS